MCPKFFIGANIQSLKQSKEVGVIIPLLQIRKLRDREAEFIVQVPTAGKRRRQGWYPHH